MNFNSSLQFRPTEIHELSLKQTHEIIQQVFVSNCYVSDHIYVQNRKYYPLASTQASINLGLCGIPLHH